MPIDLSQLNTKTIDDVTPKYFHKKLTGSGKKVGFLNEMKNPYNLSGNKSLAKTLTASHLMNTKRESYQNGNAHYTGIPFYIIPPATITNDLTHLMIDDQATPITNNQNTVIAYSLEPHSLIIQEIKENNKIVASDYSLIFRYYYWIINEPNLSTAKLVKWYEIADYYKGGLPQCCRDHPGDNFVVTGLTDNPKYEFTNPKVINSIKQINLGDPDIDVKIEDYIKNLSTYDLIKKASQIWQNDIHKILDPVFACYGKKQTCDQKELKRLLDLVQHLESYPIPLDLYQHIYNSIHTYFTTSTRRMVCALNLNLLLSDTLEQLNQSKSQLNCLPNTTVPVDSFYSQEQALAITTRDPLVLVQAGAGTGKSSTILARIDYMVKSGIDPKDITVLSFTNAAANHILEKNPRVHSMTIASMVHQIYAANYSNHQLSTLHTLANTLDIYYKNDEFAKAFKKRIYQIILNKPNAFVLMNLFVEEHFDQVIEYLNAIGQTALELEIIICYQKIGDFVEPPGVACKYMIIDEVQDNSIFEFIYTLKYVNKHKQNLFIVGDCSQTLYEFRASNPKALNILEASGVFKTYQLRTNYRSNQDILDFANASLKNIEANQFANIQLRSNQLTPVTEDSFSQKVQFYYDQVFRINDFYDKIGYHLRNTLKAYIEECISRGEQVAILAYTRRTIRLFEEELSEKFPSLTTVSLVPEKNYASTIFSDYIKNNWNKLKFAQTINILVTITQDILANAKNLIRGKNPDDIVQAYLNKWFTSSAAMIKAQQDKLVKGYITTDQFLNTVKEDMLDFEIKQNAIRQSLVSSRNEELKNNKLKQNANIILSTIHSAKGLEFDNTIVVYQAKDPMNEEDKRMYYVALTRAMNSEFVLAFGQKDQPTIQINYENILKGLQAAQASPSSQA